jgi:hypothetical protein
MSAQNVTARRGAVISSIAAAVLLVFIGAFDNQWAEGWRHGRMGLDGNDENSWISQPVAALNTLGWRVTKLSGEPTRFFIGNLVAAVLAVAFTGLLVALVCRGVGGERGRWPLFLGGWLATGLGSGIALCVGIVIAGDGMTAKGDQVTLAKGSTYYDQLGAGFEFALFIGWLIGFAAVLVYGSTAGMDELSAAPEYSSPSGYDYGSATPAAYSYSPTSPYGGSSGYGSSGYDAGGANTPTQVVPQPNEDPFGGRSSY